MLHLLWLVPALPFFGAAFLIVAGARLRRPAIAAVACASTAASALVSVLVLVGFIRSTPDYGIFDQPLWTWFSVAGRSTGFGFHLDALSAVMATTVACVSFLIHLYSVEFMIDDEGYARFFAYMNLFVASMLTLVLGESFLVLYLGWEGVGLCSYLLIGFWYRDPDNVRAAEKAFVVTRVGDAAMIVGVFLVWRELGTLDIENAMLRAPRLLADHPNTATVIALLMLGGAVGKSAQLPLQTWLPDAMAGPTPVSALIHAATMVTAGVYLIARTDALFSLSPVARDAVVAVGLVTLILGALSALAQRDIKRLLAYSTMSQVGYMFLAVGVGFWPAAIFHFFTHAFFKALLFLSAGAVILAMHHEHDITKMGGLGRKMPLTFFAFVAGGAALAGFPVITSGFYSKDLILYAAWSSPHAGHLVWAGALFGALLTSIYIFRAIFMVFFGAPKAEPHYRPGRFMSVPMIVLAVLAIGAGFLETPAALGGVPAFSEFLSLSAGPVVRPIEVAPLGAGAGEELFSLIAGVVSLIGIAIAYLVARRTMPSWLRGPARLAFMGFGFDVVYRTLVVEPFVWLARKGKGDVVDRLYAGISALCAAGHAALSRTQTGHLRWYAAAIAGGAVIAVAVGRLL